MTKFLLEDFIHFFYIFPRKIEVSVDSCRLLGELLNSLRKIKKFPKGRKKSLCEICRKRIYYRGQKWDFIKCEKIKWKTSNETFF